jgi:hypothetical protein
MSFSNDPTWVLYCICLKTSTEIYVEDASVSKVQTASSRQDLRGSSVTSEEARTACITSVNKVLHQLISRMICVVVVIEPTPIYTQLSIIRGQINRFAA